MKEAVAVALSGGVDSAVSAALLKDQGYSVSGITMRLTADDSSVKNAAAIAKLLAIPHHVIDLQSTFNSQVIEPFIDYYRRGLTPNPCIWCNKQMKFGLLLEQSLRLGIPKLATGHYSRLRQGEDGYHLLKGTDTSKDQSYFLSNLGQQELSKVLFPLGAFTKKEVRQIAVEKGIPCDKERESQDICFITDKDYRSYLKSKAKFASGDIIDSASNVLGQHQGLAFYTIGQRHGLGIPLGKCSYVLELDAASNRVMVGDEYELTAQGLEATNLSWITGRRPADLAGITAKIRYKTPEVPIDITINNSNARIIFDKPLRAITPGQQVVFYYGEEVLGGGVIEKSIPLT